MKELSLDLETFSGVDLAKGGVYRYASSPDFEILLFGYSVDGGSVTVVDLAQGEDVPEDVLRAVADGSVLKWAHNSAFERVCLSEWLKRCRPDIFPGPGYLDPRPWRCTMVWASYLGLPRSLKDVGAVLGLEAQKMEQGAALIRYFCTPCKPTRTNGGRTRNRPIHSPFNWALFKRYNQRDVEVEHAIAGRLAVFPVPDWIWGQYALDQEINDRGILVDLPMVEGAIRADEAAKGRILSRMTEITGLQNPASVVQMKGWLSERGIEADNLDKKAVASLRKAADGPVGEALALRAQVSKTSVSKYRAMKSAACADGRCRGMFRFMGAGRTGRWCSTTVQMQNLARNDMPDLAEARGLVRAGDFETLSLLYDDVPKVLSELVRTAFVPRPGCKFIVADFSAIEARVLSHMAGERWRSELFHKGGDIYCQSASRMFGVPVEKHGVNGELRQKGKIAELACIAEGQMVLTDRGLVPIQNVSLDMRLWDGEEWVAHDGVVFRGERAVLGHDGLYATADHPVWIEGWEEPVPFGTAAVYGIRLRRSGEGCPSAIPPVTRARVYDILNAGPNHRFTVSGRLVHNCGYGGGAGALRAMGALEMGIPEGELDSLVASWREANPAIVRFWWDVDRAAKRALIEKVTTYVRGLAFQYRSGMLFIRLPSGRRLAYVRPKIGTNRFGGDSITYEGTNLGKWARLETYGPKLVENVVQAVSRDILAEAMMRMRDLRIVAHVHDEVIIEAGMDKSVESVCEAMGKTPEWLPGIELKADGYECPFYMKL